MASTDRRLFDVIVLFVLALLCIPFGFDSLQDYDIGWHLAGGLWILDHLQVPERDFLAAPAAVWVAYSWLPEIIAASVFRLAGFEALQCLQLVLVWISAATLYIAAASSAVTLRARFRAAVVTLGAIPLLAPFWHLRPQLLSLIFFIVMMLWARARRLTLARAVALTILWCNCHVFWPLAALVYGWFANASRNQKFVHCALLLLAGLISPYTFQNLVVVGEYLFHHRTGYQLIREFAPMSPDLGFVFWYFLIAAAVLFVSSRTERGIRLLAPAAVFFLASLLQRKYLPFFAVSGVFLLTSRNEQAADDSQERIDSSLSKGFRIAVPALLAVLLIAELSLFRKPALEERTAELLDLVSPLSAQAGEKTAILTDFDDGGWIALSLYLRRQSGTEESNLKTTIDGRTLVMGEQRLKEYGETISGERSVCALVTAWLPHYALLSNESLLLKKLRSEPACATDWRILTSTRFWTLLETDADPRS